MLKFEKYIFYSLVLLALSIILIPKYYITGDGPSHTYNAKVLFDLINQEHREFYDFFYKINRQLIDPNWTSHLLIGFFSRFVPHWMADKLFQLIYVLTFCFGFRYLIRSIQKENSFFSVLFFPFLFTIAFQQGFYNYVLGIALLFWSVGYYIRLRQDLSNPIQQFILCALVLSVTLAHGMASVYTMMLIGVLWLFNNIKEFSPARFHSIVADFSRLLIVFIPSVILVILFMVKRGLSSTPHHKTYGQKFIDFICMNTSQSTSDMEVIPAVLCLLLILSYTLLIFFQKKSGRQLHSYEKPKRPMLPIVFLVFIAFTFFSYITSPGTISATGSIEIRIAFLPPLFLLLFLATKRWTKPSKIFFIMASCVFSVFFLVLRFPRVLAANTVAKEIMTGADYIKDESVVLNLHYDDKQVTKNGDSIFQRDNSFIHFTDFYGALADKHLIMLLNYEADKNYFPVNWKEGKSPRKFMRKMYSGQYPPCGSFGKYETYLDKKIDYVLLQNWRDDFLKLKCTRDLFNEMQAAGFTKKYESPNKYIVVWGR